MTDWKAELLALVRESTEFAKNNRIEPPPVLRPIVEPPVLSPIVEPPELSFVVEPPVLSPIIEPARRTTIEPSRLPPVSLPKSERDEIRERVSNFKAHQERFMREREQFAAPLLKKMQERTPPVDRK
jgi:hypothetical protein